MMRRNRMLASQDTNWWKDALIHTNLWGESDKYKISCPYKEFRLHHMSRKMCIFATLERLYHTGLDQSMKK